MVDCGKKTSGILEDLYCEFSFCVVIYLQIMKTEFVPKLVATATTCCALYLVLRVCDHMMTVKTLASVGYFDSLVCSLYVTIDSSMKMQYFFYENTA